MKKMFFAMVMVMMAVVVNAQIITDMEYVDGNPMLYLSNGQKVWQNSLPRARYEVGYTIDQCIAMTAQKRYMEEARHYQMPVGGYGMGMVYGGGYPVVYGGSGTSFSIGNEHWGFSTSSSNYGGYKTSSTGVRVGSFQVGMSNAGYSQPTATSNGCYGRSTSTATSYQAQKKADAKKAASRYSNMKNNVVTSSNAQASAQSSTTTTTSNKPIKEMNVKSFLKGF